MTGPSLDTTSLAIQEDPKLMAGLQLLQDNAPNGLEGIIRRSSLELLRRASECRCEDPKALESLGNISDACFI